MFLAASHVVDPRMLDAAMKCKSIAWNSNGTVLAIAGTASLNALTVLMFSYKDALRMLETFPTVDYFVSSSL